MENYTDTEARPAEADLTETDMTETINPEELTLEEAFKRLDALSARLEDRDIPLEEAFDLYRQGMELLKICSG